MAKLFKGLLKMVFAVFTVIGIVASALVFWKVKNDGFYFMMGSKPVTSDDLEEK